MLRARDLRHRTARQIVLAVLVLLAVTTGSLAHSHRVHPGQTSSTDHCTACMLHTVVSDPTPAIVVPTPPLAPRQEQVVVAVQPLHTTDCPLSLAPKTSPPAVA